MSNSINKDLRKKTNAELAELIVKCKDQLLQIRFNVANGESEKLHTVEGIRKMVARSLTILNERSMQVKQAQTVPVKQAPVSKAIPKVAKTIKTTKPKTVKADTKAGDK